MIKRDLRLTIIGSSGSGKTRLKTIIKEHLKSEHPEYHVISDTFLLGKEVLHINVDDFKKGELNAKN